MCNEKEKYIEKTIGNNPKGFKVGINQYTSDCRRGVSTCKFPRYVNGYDIKNKFLVEPFFSLNIMLQLNKSYTLETIKNHFNLGLTSQKSRSLVSCYN